MSKSSQEGNKRGEKPDSSSSESSGNKLGSHFMIFKDFLHGKFRGKRKGSSGPVDHQIAEKERAEREEGEEEEEEDDFPEGCIMSGTETPFGSYPPSVIRSFDGEEHCWRAGRRGNRRDSRTRATAPDDDEVLSSGLAAGTPDTLLGIPCGSSDLTCRSSSIARLSSSPASRSPRFSHDQALRRDIAHKTHYYDYHGYDPASEIPTRGVCGPPNITLPHGYSDLPGHLLHGKSSSEGLLVEIETSGRDKAKLHKSRSPLVHKSGTPPTKNLFPSRSSALKREGLSCPSSPPHVPTLVTSCLRSPSPSSCDTEYSDSSTGRLIRGAKKL